MHRIDTDREEKGLRALGREDQAHASLVVISESYELLNPVKKGRQNL
jgi:hypothetical protein